MSSSLTTSPAVARLHRWSAPVAHSLTATLTFIADRAAEEVGVSAGAGITLMTTEGRRITSVGTNAVAERLNALHDRHPHNPCAVAWLTGTAVGVTAHSRQWPEWVRQARDIGAQSVLFAPLSTPERLLGTLMVYAPGDRAYRRSDGDMLAGYARDAAILVDETQAARSQFFAASAARR